MILNNAQLYDAVKKTIVDLERLGKQEDAGGLRVALSASSLPSEILGEIRIALQRIELNELPKAVEYEIAGELTYIESVLGQLDEVGK